MLIDDPITYADTYTTLAFSIGVFTGAALTFITVLLTKGPPKA